MTKRLVETYIEVEENINIPTATNEFRYLYMIYNRFTKLTKVGVTNSMTNRLNQLSAQNGVDLDLVMYLELEVGIDISAKWLEEFVHSYFKKQRQRGEWFDFNLRNAVELRSLLYYIHGEHIEDNMLELLKTT